MSAHERFPYGPTPLPQALAVIDALLQTSGLSRSFAFLPSHLSSTFPLFHVFTPRLSMISRSARWAG